MADEQQTTTETGIGAESAAMAQADEAKIDATIDSAVAPKAAGNEEGGDAEGDTPNDGASPFAVLREHVADVQNALSDKFDKLSAEVKAMLSSVSGSAQTWTVDTSEVDSLKQQLAEANETVKIYGEQLDQLTAMGAAEPGTTALPVPSSLKGWLRLQFKELRIGNHGAEEFAWLDAAIGMLDH